MAKLRKHLYMPGLLTRVRSQFNKIPDAISSTTKFSLSDCLMSGLAMFGMKYPSLLQFDDAAHNDEIVRHNLKMLYGIAQAPCDTYFRERLDPLDSEHLQRATNRVIAQLQRGKLLEAYRFYQDSYLVPIDGTSYFSSPEIHCASCCEKHHKDGSVTYYHQMLSAVLAHPFHRTVFPLIEEPIVKQDGQSKNDCEHNALKRLLVNLRRAHPHLEMIVTLDGLYADGPIIRLLHELNYRFIITAKETDLSYLFEFYKAAKKASLEKIDTKGKIKLAQHYEWVNRLPLNDTHPDLEVNLLTYCEKGKKEQRFSWITDLPLGNSSVERIMKGGRARWRIENETFNTLKNQGYQFEHNFGHGNQNLSMVLAKLMFLAFLLDQVQEYACKYFKAAFVKYKRRTYLWDKLRGCFLHYFFDDWEEMYSAILEGFRPGALRAKDLLNTS